MQYRDYYYDYIALRHLDKGWKEEKIRKHILGQGESEADVDALMDDYHAAQDFAYDEHLAGEDADVIRQELISKGWSEKASAAIVCHVTIPKSRKVWWMIVVGALVLFLGPFLILATFQFICDNTFIICILAFAWFCVCSWLIGTGVLGKEVVYRRRRIVDYHDIHKDS